MKSSVFLFAVVLFSVNLNLLLAQDTGSADAKQAELEQLKAELAAFMQKLDNLVKTPVQEPVVPADEDYTEPEFEPEVEPEYDDFDAEKRCPNDCKKNQNHPKSCDRRCPKCCNEETKKEESPIMKRFLAALPVAHQQLVQNSPKKTYIERLLRRGVAAPQAEKADREVKAQVAQPAKRGVLSIGVRALSDHDSDSMSSFRRSLSTKDQQLLRNYHSKTRFIEGLLRRKTVQDARDVDIPHEKRQVDTSDPEVQQFIANLDDSQKQLIQEHPDMLPKLKIAIEKGPSVEVESSSKKKRDEVTDQILAQLTPEEKAIVQKHLSQLQHLKEAQSRPVGNPDEEASVEQVVGRMMNEIQTAKKRGISISKVIEAMKKRESSSNKQSDKRRSAAAKKREHP